jgi:predicted AlkP superfamily phosphohydrolase/phosphomutase
MATLSRLLVIGLDSADRHLIEQWVADGSLPNFQRLYSDAVRGDSRNPTGLVAGTVWPTFYSGVRPGRTGRFRGTTQFLTGTYQHGDIGTKIYDFPNFWEILSRNGRRTTVIDAPYAFLSSEPNVTQVVDWCSHSPWKDGTTVSSPPELTAWIRERYGRDPVGKCDFAHLDNTEDFRRFTDGLCARIQTRTALTLELLRDSSSEVFFNVFSECHCAGHQLWHIHDPSHPLHDPQLLTALGGDPLKRVYKAVDAAVGQLIQSVDPGTGVLVFCSHGIGPAYTGTHLLDEILLRLEGRSSPKRRQGLAQVMVSAWTRLPQRVRTFLTPLQKRLWPRLKANLVQPGKGNRKYFEIIVNDAAGGIRLNLKGREPDGIVEPGAEYDEICAQLRRDLLEVVNPATGNPLVDRIIKTRDTHAGLHADRLPDLLVIWNRSGPISEAKSPRIGHIRRKFVFRNHRTGDHTEDDGLFFFMGPGIVPCHLDEVSVADLAPTIAAMFGVEIPDADGQPLEALVGYREPAAMAAESS